MQLSPAANTTRSPALSTDIENCTTSDTEKIATPTTNAGFNADWISPPGDLIEEVLEEFGWIRAELAQRLDFSAKHVNELFKGRAPITADSAERLERVLGHDAGFW